MFDIEEELKKLPAKPGVYLMHNERDEIIYVGKAISLKNRVRQYFQSSRNPNRNIVRAISLPSSSVEDNGDSGESYTISIKERNRKSLWLVRTMV